MLTLDKSILIISHKLTVEICTLRKNYSGGFGRYFAPLYYDVMRVRIQQATILQVQLLPFVLYLFYPY